MNTVETVDNEEILELCKQLEGDWQSSSGISYNGDTIEISPYGSEEIYQVKVAGYFRSLVSESIGISR